MLARWLNRDGLGQMLAPDAAVAEEPVPDEKTSWFWQVVAPDPNFQPVKTPPNEAFYLARTMMDKDAFVKACPTVVCEHCGKQTTSANAILKSMRKDYTDDSLSSPTAASPKLVGRHSVHDRDRLSTEHPPASSCSEHPPVTPRYDSVRPQPLATPSPHPSSFASAYRSQRSDADLRLEQLVLSAAKETARSMNSPPNQVEQRNKVFRLCGNTSELSEKLASRLEKILTKDPTLLSARATHLGNLVPDGYTCFMAAAYAGNVKAVKIILDVAAALPEDAEIDVISDRDLQGRTALHIAAELGHVEVVEVLQAKYDGFPNDRDAVSASSASAVKSLQHPLAAAPPVDLLGRTPFGRVMTSPNPKTRKKQKELESILFSPVDSSVRGVPDPLSERVGTEAYFNQLFALYGTSDMPGMRVTMEDCILSKSWRDPNTHECYTLLGVCDGHDDHGQVSKFVAETIPVVLQDLMQQETEAPDATLNWQVVFTKACLETDHRLRQQNIKGGSTGVFALITEKSIVVANVGDSRCILVQSEASAALESSGLNEAMEKLRVDSGSTSKDDNESEKDEGYPEAIDQDAPQLVNEETLEGVDRQNSKPDTNDRNCHITPLSFDHKPDNEVEKRRIENAGFSVKEINFRDENGKELVFHKIVRSATDQLAVARAFGDFEYKANGTLGPEEQAVIAVPDVVIHDRNTKSDMYLALACDGIWDVMSNEEVGSYVADQIEMKVQLNPQIGSIVLPKVGDELLSMCLDKGSRDNMSAILVALNQAADQLSSPALQGKDDPVKALSFS